MPRLLPLLLLSLLLASCTTEEVQRTSTIRGMGSASPRTDRPVPRSPDRIPEPLRAEHYTGVGQLSVNVTTAFQYRGRIPYDNMSLPLVSPDGRFIATQTGLPPDWDTLWATRDARVPDTTRIEIYRLHDDPTQSPVLHATVDETALLGRAVDAEGFLIEAPQDNGSRWIGRASWDTAEVSWLVGDDTSVNAFATMGADGRLAWSRRAIDRDEWELVVRHGASQWTMPPSSGDWLMPTWTGYGDALFVLLLRGEALDIVYAQAADADSMRRTIRRQPLATEKATIGVAYDTLHATSVLVAPIDYPPDHVTFHHPSHYGRAAIWRPPNAVRLLGRGSMTAVLDWENPQFALVATRKALVRQQIAWTTNEMELIADTHVPRSTALPDHPYILLHPGDGTIAVTHLDISPAR